jgi:hypothetical protein
MLLNRNSLYTLNESTYFRKRQFIHDLEAVFMNICSSAHEHMFIGLRTYVTWLTNICSFLRNSRFLASAKCKHCVISPLHSAYRKRSFLGVFLTRNFPENSICRQWFLSVENRGFYRHRGDFPWMGSIAT